MNKPIALTAIVASFSMGIACSACTWLRSPQGAATVAAGVDVTVCVLNHSTETVDQIVADCGAATVEDVVKILDAHHAAMDRELTQRNLKVK